MKVLNEFNNWWSIVAKIVNIFTIGLNICNSNIINIIYSGILQNDVWNVNSYFINKSGIIKVGVIGVFNPFVLFLSPIVDSYLIESSQKANDYMLRVSEIGNQGRYIPNNWVPHMAVAMKMSKEGFCKSFERLAVYDLK